MSLSQLNHLTRMIDFNFINKFSLPLESLSKLSYDSTNSFSVVDKSINWFNFDNASNSKMKTFDSLYYVNNKLIFAEFKNSKPLFKEFLLKLKLKFHESISCFFLKATNVNPTFTFNDFILVDKEFYYVFSKIKSSPSDLMHYKMNNRIWSTQYESIYNCKIFFVDNIEFERVFGL
jgi:hypothetical protein